jgi:predicted XRE-type DNA-binding protein
MSNSVFYQIVEDEDEAKRLEYRSYLMRTLTGYLKGTKLSVEQLASQYGADRQQLNDLFDGKIDKFNAVSLQQLAQRTGLGSIL